MTYLIVAANQSVSFAPARKFTGLLVLLGGLVLKCAVGMHDFGESWSWGWV